MPFIFNHVFKIKYFVFRKQSVINCEGDQKKLFSLIHSLFGSKKITVLPEYTSSFTLATSINMFFNEKIHNIKMEFPLLEACLPAYSFVDIVIICVICGLFCLNVYYRNNNNNNIYLKSNIQYI